MSKPARQQRCRKMNTIMIKAPLFTRHHLQKREYVKANKGLLHACYLYAYTASISLASAGGRFLNIQKAIEEDIVELHHLRACQIGKQYIFQWLLMLILLVQLCSHICICIKMYGKKITLH